MPVRLALLLAVAAAACAGPDVARQQHRQARLEADAAHQAGRYVDAVRGYDRACELDATDTEACRVAGELREWVVVRAVRDAREPCAAGDVDRCAGALAGARSVAPDDPRILRRLDEAGGRRLTACTEADPVTPGDRMAQLSCAAAAVPVLDTDGYRREVAVFGRQVAGHLGDVAAQPAMQVRPGAALTLHLLARCASPGAHAAALELAARRFVAAHRVPVEVVARARGVDPGTFADVCDRVADGVDRVHCAPGGLRVDLDVELQPAEHSATEELRQERYQVGVDRIANPAYRAAERRATRAERARRELELERLDRRNACERAEERVADAGYCYDCPERQAEEERCREAARFDELYAARVAEARAADSALASTPEILEEAVYETARYVVRHHRWSARFRARVSIEGVTVGSLADEIVFTDSEHGGAAAAGLAPDPQRPPPRGHFAGAIASAVREPVARAISGALAERSARAAESCRGEVEWTAAWLGCWAESRWLGGAPLEAPALMPELRCLR